jgi:hypothetical protein
MITISIWFDKVVAQRVKKKYRKAGSAKAGFFISIDQPFSVRHVRRRTHVDLIGVSPTISRFLV